jgi:uncharacterized membrane protein
LGRYFLTGVFAVLPVVITAAVAIWLVELIAKSIGPGTVAGKFLREVGFSVTSNTAIAYVAGWGFVLTFILLVGMLVEKGTRRVLQRRVDGLLSRLPVVGSIYKTARQLVSMLDKKPDDSLSGMKVVFCRFGKDTGATFLALLPTQDRFHVGGVDCHAVLVPTAPIPFGGSLLFVPVASIQPAELSIDAFMSIYVSMGVSGGQFLPATINASDATPTSGNEPEQK